MTPLTSGGLYIGHPYFLHENYYFSFPTQDSIN